MGGKTLMPTFYMDKESRRVWKSLSDDTDLAAFGLDYLQQRAFKDSDGGYSYSLEFWRDGVRTFIHGQFEGYDTSCDLDGSLSDCHYGTAEVVNDYFGHTVVKPHPYQPHRDFLLIGSYGMPGGISYLGN